MAHFVDPDSSLSQGLNGAGGGAFTSRLSVKILLLCRLSVKIFDSLRLSVNRG